jgi:drug/metabolite transporter, DME family
VIRHRPEQGALLVLAAAMIFGTTGTTQALAPDSATPLGVGSVRVVLGGVALVAIARARGYFRGGKRWAPLPTAVMASCVAGSQLAFFASVDQTGVAIGTIVTIGSAPVAAGILGFLVHRERPSLAWLAATVLAVIGCTMLVTSGGDVAVDPGGIALALLAGAGYAAYTVASKTLLAQHRSGAVIAVAFGLAAIPLAFVLATQPLGWIGEPEGILAVAHLGLITVALAYTLFAKGLMKIASATAVTLTLAEPMTAAILGVVVLNEALTTTSLVGSLLILVGLLVLTLGPTPNKQELATAPEVAGVSQE